MKSHYKILEVEETATQEEIKRSYRALSKKWHPDKHHNSATHDEAESMYKEITVAYSILGDPEKRKFYDETGLDTKPESIEETAAKKVQELFIEIMKTDFDKEQLFNVAQDALENAIYELNNAVETAKRNVSNLEKRIIFLKSVEQEKSSSSRAHLNNSIKGEINNLESNISQINIDQIQHQVIIHEKALEILKNDYPREPIAESNIDSLAERMFQQHANIIYRKSPFSQWGP